MLKINWRFNWSKWLFLGLILLLAFLGWRLGAQQTTRASLLSLADHTIVDWDLAGHPIKAEVVNTAPNIAQGLGGRTGVLDGTDGMLFVFPEPQSAVFWMKEMEFPIDLFWLRDGLVVGVERNLMPPTPDTPDQELIRYSSPEPVDMVLETPAGRFNF